MGKFFIGTSGWSYSHWNKVFYPPNLLPKERLKYYSKNFKAVEINYSFYRLPKIETYQKWRLETPPGFLFSLKVSRFITHIKRLDKEAIGPYRKFMGNALFLEEKLGPILFQFPPNFKASGKNIGRLEKFLSSAFSFQARHKTATLKPLRIAVEFRDKSWCSKIIYGLLRKYKIAWVITDYLNCPKMKIITADFVYIRMHGPKTLFSSKYKVKELKELAQELKKWRKLGLDSFVYFNNDFRGYAVKNAKTLRNLLKK